MSNIEDTLKKRLEQLKDHEPTISIFKGRQRIISWGGEQTVEERIYVQLETAFREKQLAQLRGAGKLAVFLCLALHINEEGLCWPSIDTISKETGYGKDTVYAALKSLEKMGFIARKKRRDEDGAKLSTNLYQIFPSAYRKQSGR
jgi:DNA-binding transcriptional ArsR family regulator